MHPAPETKTCPRLAPSGSLDGLRRPGARKLLHRPVERGRLDLDGPIRDSVARPGDVLPFASELGPPRYAITLPDGREFSDRWEQSLVMKKLAEQAWERAIAER